MKTKTIFQNCSLVALVLVFIMLIVASCMRTTSVVETEQSLPILTTNSMTTSTVLTIESTGLPGLVEEELKIDPTTKLLLNVTDHLVALGMCYPPGSAGVWILSFPFTEHTTLLSSSDKNFFAPTWSPDGQWIAYIESKPAEEKLGDQSTPNPPGTDSIWVMRKDGSDKHRVSAYFDSVDVRDSRTCYRLTYIVPILNWSSDGKYLHFEHRQLYSDGLHGDHFIIDLETKATVQIASSRNLGDGAFAWASDNRQYIMFDRDALALWVGEPGGDEISAQKDLPTDLLSGDSISTVAWPVGQSGPLLINRSQENSLLTIWSYDFSSNDWKKQWEHTGQQIEVGLSWSVVGQDGKLLFVDQKEWGIHGAVPAHGETYDAYFYFPRLTDVTGQEIISFLDSETNSIWLVGPSMEIPHRLINWRVLNSTSNHWIIPGGVSWQP